MEKRKYLDFEQPILELEERIQALRTSADEGGINSIMNEISEVENKLNSALRELSSRLTPWQRTQLARHPMRPEAPDLAERIFEDIFVVHGDRQFTDDAFITTALAKLRGQEVLLIYQQKGKDPADCVRYNFGMAHPEGYRKAMRIASLAERFAKPIVLFIDTPGAYPGIGAEERGQAWAIAASIEHFMNIRVPTVAVVVGEGGSGGALALGVADKVFMMENSVYSVISPEGCASILFRDASRAPEAAAALKLTAEDALRMGVIDQIVEEPAGGAHRNWDLAAQCLGDSVFQALKEIRKVKIDKLINRRYDKFRKIGVINEAGV